VVESQEITKLKENLASYVSTTVDYYLAIFSNDLAGGGFTTTKFVTAKKVLAGHNSEIARRITLLRMKLSKKMGEPIFADINSVLKGIEADIAIHEYSAASVKVITTLKRAYSKLIDPYLAAE
jgi:hypothetical protein